MVSNEQFKELGILIADDHKVVANLLKAYLDDSMKFGKIYTAYSKKGIMEVIKKQKIDIILLDILLPDSNGLEVGKEILEKYPNTQLIFLTAINSRKVIVECFQIGAKRFLFKSANIEETMQAIETVSFGDKYYSRECLNMLIQEEAQTEEYTTYIQNSTDLTDREKEILKMLVEEKNIPEIADKLNLSPRTVETHKRNIMAKYGAKTTIGLVKMVLNKQLAENDITKN